MSSYFGNVNVGTVQGGLKVQAYNKVNIAGVDATKFLQQMGMFMYILTRLVSMRLLFFALMMITGILASQSMKVRMPTLLLRRIALMTYRLKSYR